MITEILDTEIQLTLGKLLGASKELSLGLQECLRLRNRPVTEHQVAVGTAEALPIHKSKLLMLTVECNGAPITAIVDTGSELNLVQKEIANRSIGLPIDMTKPVKMRDANGGTKIVRGFLKGVTLTCGIANTICDLNVGDFNFDLLLGRTWQRDNYGSIVEKKDGTYLEFKDRPTDAVICEVLV